MGLLNSENEDVTNITSESSNSCTSLKIQRTRWKRSSSWTWPMSPPFTSSDTTCYQHFSLLPLPRWSMLTQCILQHHQICNLEAEPVKMNELIDRREGIIPWFLRCRGIWHEFSISNRNNTECFKIPRLHPHETQYIPDSSYAILRNTPFQHQCDDSNQLIGDCGDFFDSIAMISCYRSKSTASSTHRLGQFR